MPEKIQRVPRGLNNLLTISGGQTPQLISDQITGTLDLLQFYGLTQVQRRQAVDAAWVEGTLMTITVPATEYWIWYTAELSMAKSATVTTMEASLAYGPAGQQVTVQHFSRAPGTTAAAGVDTGTLVFGFQSNYPVVLLPTWTITARLDILGADANVGAALSALVGVLG